MRRGSASAEDQHANAPSVPWLRILPVRCQNRLPILVTPGYRSSELRQTAHSVDDAEIIAIQQLFHGFRANRALSRARSEDPHRN